MEALAELREVTDTVTYGELAALRRRLWADEAGAYRWFGQYLPAPEQRGVIETDFADRVHAALARGGALGEWAERLRAEITPVLPLARLLNRHPSLDFPVIAPNVAAWRVLARFGGVFEVNHGWAAVPDLATAVARTKEIVAELGDALRAESPAEAFAARGFALTDDELVAWLAQCGYRVSPSELRQPRRALHRIVERISPGTRTARGPTATDTAAELLTQAGVPLHLDDLLQRMGRRYSRGPLYNRLNADSRFARVAPSTFALESWHLKPYAGPSGSSTDNAVQLIERAGRPLHLDEIRAELSRPITREGLRNALNATHRLVRVAPSTYDVRRSD
ncbi:winged helix-turn-helix domain-containing protein [Amycolatopsis sp. GM8]|uniref:winged helix-turn-helix domain-containing protein n=1 Tax=Amycolatopsis sp. GM8 TaxID=2896530 RepID=UPI001F1FC205|nr:winged helix-turn-helix domain-containing protein [Amycolatopsis sp. GM8]